MKEVWIVLNGIEQTGKILHALVARCLNFLEPMRRFRWELTVCAMFKNEARYLDEWLTFHSRMGVSHFVLYDDASSDNFMEVLAPWVADGMVTLRSANRRRQLPLYRHALKTFRNRSRWIAFIDIDEFLFSPKAIPLPSVLRKWRRRPAIFVYWLLFGSNGHQNRPDGPVLDSYTRCMSLQTAIFDDFDHRYDGQKMNYVTGWARDGKSIVNPRAVTRLGIHRPQELSFGFVVDENFGRARRHAPVGTSFSCEVLRINHYWSKSLSELDTKIGRGLSCWKPGVVSSLDRSHDRERMLNEVEDFVVLEVLKKMESSA